MVLYKYCINKKNDYIEFFVKNNSGTQNPTVVDLNIIINKVPA